MGLCIFSLAGFMALVTRKNLETRLPMTVTVMVGILYAFGLFGQLTAGFYAVLILAALAFAALAFWMFRMRKERPLRYLLTPGSAVLAVAFIWLLLSLRQHLFYECDEFSHWGLAVQNMFYFHAIPTGVSESNLLFYEYPPATTLFEYFFTRLSGSFNEGDPQRAMNLLTLSYLLPMMATQSWKHWKSAACMAVFLVAFPLLFVGYTYQYLLVDGLLGCIMLYSLWIWFFQPHDRETPWQVGSALAMLTLTKNTGFLLAGLVLAIIALDLCLRRRGGWKKLIVPVCTVAMAKLSWTLFFRIYQAGQAWDTASLLPAVWDALRNGLHGYRLETVQLFLQALCKPGLMTEGGAIPLSTALWLVLITAAYLWLSSQLPEEQRKRYRRLLMMLVTGMALYMLGQLTVYLFLLQPYEARSLGSLSRYMSTMTLPVTGVTAMLAVHVLKDRMEKSGQSAALCLLAALLLVLSPETVAQRLILPNEQDQAALEMRLPDIPRQEVVSVLDRVEDQVYVIVQGDRGDEFRRFRYELAPLTVQPQSAGWCLVEEAYEVITPEDWIYMTFGTVKTASEWAQELVEDGYDYVYLQQTDETFAASYGGLFGGAEKVKQGELYRVAPDGGDVILYKVDFK